MKTSPNGLAFVARWEGEVLRVYHDAAGVATIGVGHALKPGEAFPDGITHEQALGLLATDIGIAEHAVDARVPAGALSQNAFDACVSFAFNCGGGAFAQSQILANIKAGNMQAAAGHFTDWCKRKDPATGLLVTDQGLLSRRKAEAALFLTPDAPDLAPSATALLS